MKDYQVDVTAGKSTATVRIPNCASKEEAEKQAKARLKNTGFDLEGTVELKAVAR